MKSLNTYVIPILLIVGFSIASVTFLYLNLETVRQRYQSQQPIPTEKFETMAFLGTLKTGEEVGKDYCAQGVYLETESEEYGLLQLKNADGITESLEKYSDLIGKEVIVEGVYPEGFRCMALECSCDQGIHVVEVANVEDSIPLVEMEEVDNPETQE